MPSQRLKTFLDQHHVPWTSVRHPEAFSANEIVRLSDVAPEQLAKTVVIDLDGQLALVVLPSNYRIRWDRLSDAMYTDFVELADEDEFIDRFAKCERGAIPPFGKLFGMSVFFCEHLSRQPAIYVSAGTHNELLRMKTEDYLDLEQPLIINEGFMRPNAARPEWLKGKPRAAMMG